MSLEREIRPIARTAADEAVVVKATCDACGSDCWHPAHRRPVATLGRVQDDERGSMGYWELDLCVPCKDEVMAVLRRIAGTFGRELPNERSDEVLPALVPSWPHPLRSDW